MTDPLRPTEPRSVPTGDAGPHTSWTGRVGLLLWTIATLTLMAVAAGALTTVEPRWRWPLVVAAATAWVVGVALRLRRRR